MKVNKSLLIFVLFFFIFSATIYGLFSYFSKRWSGTNIKINPNTNSEQISMSDSEVDSESVAIQLEIPISKTLNNDYHIFQTFNNCGPASLSMALSYYGINISQKVLGDALRPYQVVNGNNDDKSVTLEELAVKAEEYGLVAYHRPSGDFEKLKYFIAYDMPVITRTWLEPDEDIGHYRVIKGYDDEGKIIIQDDSLQGRNLSYTYEEFLEIWKKYNYEYLVLVTQDKIEVTETILGDDINENKAWERAVKISQTELEKNPNDIYARFNLSVALFNTGDFRESVKEFEKIENKISNRTLWYQIEPILAYYYLKDYGRVFEISNSILNNHNRAFSELYILRAKIYEDRDQENLADEEYRKAKLYNLSIDIKDPLILNN